jgi:Flp pilus assembly protein TadG
MNNARGSVTLFVVFIALALFAGAGLVIDGGAAITAASRASDIAQNAARAGIIEGSVPGSDGAIGIEDTRARAAAIDWLAREHVIGTDADVTVTPDLVTVTVRMQQPTALLRLAGIGDLHVERTGAARPASGITKEGA